LPSAASAASDPSSQIVLLSRAKRKSLTMTAVVSVCFAVCWLPWCVAMLLLTFGINVAGGEEERRAKELSQNRLARLNFLIKHNSFFFLSLRGKRCAPAPRDPVLARFPELDDKPLDLHVLQQRHVAASQGQCNANKGSKEGGRYLQSLPFCTHSVVLNASLIG
jgi:hypothetical protein